MALTIELVSRKFRDGELLRGDIVLEKIDVELSVGVALSFDGALDERLPSPETPSYPILSAIDSYGETVFNYLQVDQFLKEWDSLDLSGFTADQSLAAEHLRKLALRCKNERLLLWFLGD